MADCRELKVNASEIVVGARVVHQVAGVDVTVQRNKALCKDIARHANMRACPCLAETGVAWVCEHPVHELRV